MMRFGAEYELDPIHIKGTGPRRGGIFADTSYSDLPPAESDTFTLEGRKPSGLLLLALLAGGVYLAVKS